MSTNSRAVDCSNYKDFFNVLFYMQGCVPRLVSSFHYILSVVAGVCIIIGPIPVIIMLYTLASTSALLQIIGGGYIPLVMGNDLS